MSIVPMALGWRYGVCERDLGCVGVAPWCSVRFGPFAFGHRGPPGGLPDGVLDVP